MTVSGSQWALGGLAGGTIFLGLPIARLRRVTPKLQGFLNAASTGILIFLLVEMTGHLLDGLEELIEEAVEHGGSMGEAFRHGSLFALGFSAGLLGLMAFERRYLGSAKDGASAKNKTKRLAMMIAIGLGVHNLSEGLAIGQGYASGALKLAWLLTIGFALHNATEGFRIAAPLSGQRVSWRFLTLAGLVAGGPTFLGAVIGSWWVNDATEVFCLSLASGTILYLIGELLHLGRQLKEETVVGLGLLAGFFAALATDVFLSAFGGS